MTLAMQTAAPSIADKATAYGFPGVRVDGNDLLAVIAAALAAAERARRVDGLTMIEAVTFRMGGHSSSDDPTRYRDAGLVAEWERRDPIPRFRTYLSAMGVVSERDEAQWTREVQEAIGA